MNKKAYNPIVILTGAGVSAESGIPTFRAADGLWENHRIEDVASPGGFARDPALVHKFYNARREKLLDVAIKPNPAHKAIGRLEKEYKGKVTVVTQNIDNLHERGGTDRIIHMHGELLKGFCHFCRERFPCETPLSVEDVCHSCGRRGGLRPDIVWFGEMPYRMDEIGRLLEECGIFISIGTSGNVYPAAGFVELAAQSGAKTIEVNREPSLGRRNFEECRYGKAGTLVPVLVDELLAG